MTILEALILTVTLAYTAVGVLQLLYVKRLFELESSKVAYEEALQVQRPKERKKAALPSITKTNDNGRGRFITKEDDLIDLDKVDWRDGYEAITGEKVEA